MPAAPQSKMAIYLNDNSIIQLTKLYNSFILTLKSGNTYLIPKLNKDPTSPYNYKPITFFRTSCKSFPENYKKKTKIILRRNKKN